MADFLTANDLFQQSSNSIPVLPDSMAAIANQAITAAQTQLQAIATDPNLIPKLQTAFGETFNLNTANSIFAHFANGDFSVLPTVEILSDRVLPTANGAFAAATNRVYLSDRFVTENAAKPDVLTGVVLEEYGHAIDSLINVADSPGDEGEIFAAISQGKKIGENELLALKTEDDTSTITLDGKSLPIEMSQIAIESLNSRLYQSHRGFDNNIYTRSSTDGINWTSWIQSGGGTPSAPALAALNNRLYQSHKGFDNNIYTRSSTDGINWTSWVQSGGSTPSTPALAALNGKLYQTIQGQDSGIYTRSSTDGINWTNWAQSGGSTPSAPALAALNGKLYQTIRGQDSGIYTRSSTDGMNWTNWNNNGGGGTPSAPTLEASNGKLYQSHRGFDNKIYTRSSTDGVNWTAWNNTGGGDTPDSPSLADLNGRLYQTIQGQDNGIYTRSSTDGVNWTSWNNNGGGGTPTGSGTPNTTTVTITGTPIADNNTLPTITITASDASAAETNGGQANANPGEFTITRTGSTAKALTVNYTFSGTAKFPSDYDIPSGFSSGATIAAGQTSVKLPINIENDSDVENDETVVLSLSPNSTYTLGNSNSATITIADNDNDDSLSTNTRLFTTSISGTSDSSRTYGVESNGIKGESIGGGDLNDYSRLTLSEPSYLSASLDGLQANADLQVIQDTNNNGSIDVGEVLGGSYNGGSANEAITNLKLGSGKYFVRVFSADGIKTKYNLSVQKVPVGDGNNIISAAQGFSDSIDMGNVRQFGISSSVGLNYPSNDPVDYYTFNVDNLNRKFSLSMTDLQADADVQLLDANGIVIKSSESRGTASESIRTTLIPGKYFIRVYPNDPSAPTLNYKLTSLLSRNKPPTITNFPDQTLTVGDSTYFNYSDPDGDLITKFQYRYPTNSGVGVFTNVRGTNESNIGNTTIVNVDIKDASTRFRADNPGTDTFGVRAFDGLDWSDWKDSKITVKWPNRPPVVNASDLTVKVQDLVSAPGDPYLLRLQGRFSVSDPDGDPITKYRFYDLSGRNAGAGYLKNDSAVDAQIPGYPAGTVMEIDASQLGKQYYGLDKNKLYNTDRVGVSAFDGAFWSALKEFSITVQPTPTQNTNPNPNPNPGSSGNTGSSTGSSNSDSNSVGGLLPIASSSSSDSGPLGNVTIKATVLPDDWVPYTIGKTKGNDDRHIVFERPINSPGYIDNDRPTWIVIHGWNGQSGDFRDLVSAIENYQPGDQVITLDWDAARLSSIVNGVQLKKAELGVAASWIEPVAQSAVNVIKSWGLKSDNVNLVGHSLGAYVAYEMAKRLGGINNLVALNPASITNFGYNHFQVDFSRYSKWSWAFFQNDLTDNPEISVTARESFKIDELSWPWDGHGAAEKLWANMLRDRNGSTSKYFGLDDFGLGAPWARVPGFDATIKTSNWTPIELKPTVKIAS